MPPQIRLLIVLPSVTQISADDFDFASHIAVNPNDNLVYVTSQDANAITVIDGNTDRIIGQNKS